MNLQNQPQQRYQPPVSAPKNPGQVTGIIGIVLSFIFLAPIGLILSIVSIVQSKNANQSTVLGIVGVILNFLAIIGGFIALALMITAYNGVQDRAQESSRQAGAGSLIRHAEAYNTLEGEYPENIAQMNANPKTKLDAPTGDYQYVDGQPTSSKEVGYKRCANDGAQVYYFKAGESRPAILPLGNERGISVC